MSSLLFLGQVFQNLPALEESAWYMEAALPLTTFEREQHLASAVQVAKPFRILAVGKVAPSVFVYALKPFQAFFLAGELVAFEHRDERFDVHPPKLLDRKSVV